MADILLSIGINLNDLKSAQQKIAAELGSWKTSTSVDLVDKKSLSDTEKMTKELTKEFSKLGTAVGKNDLSKYLKIDPSVATKATDAFQAINKETNVADGQLTKLAQTTAFYNSKSAIMKTSLSDVKAELNSYLKVEAQGITLDATSAARKEELVTSYKKLNKEQNGFMHGIDLPRLMLWAVGWKIMYGALNLVMNAVMDTISTIVNLNETIDTVRVTSGKTGAAFTTEFNKIKEAIAATSYNSKISITSLSNAFRILTFESLNTQEAVAALSHVRDLMRITGEKEGVVAQALAETYGLYHGKIKGATTVSEEFAEITNTLAQLFTKAHVTIAEYQQIMGYIAPTGAKATESLHFLVNMIVFADEQMLGGRRAAMALSESLIGLTEDSAKLRENLGIIFPYGTVVTFEKVLREVRVITKDMSEEARKEYLQKMFKGTTLQLALKLLSLSDEKLKSMGDKAGVFADELARAMDSSHSIEIFFSNITKKIVEEANVGLSYWNDIAYKLSHFDIFVKTYWVFQPGEKPEDVQKRFMEEVAKSETAKLTKKAEKEAAKKASTPEGIAAAAQEAADAALTFQERMAKVALSPSLIKDIKAFNRESEISILESSGANKALIVREKIGNIIANAADELFNQEKSQEAINRLTEVRYGTVEEIVRVMKTLGIDDVQATKVATEMVKERLELTKEMAEEVKSLADEFQGVATDFTKNLMSGTANIKDMMASVVGIYQASFADQVGKMLGDTGIFSGMAEMFMSPLQKARQSLYDGIVAGCAEGAKSLAAGVSGKTGVATAVGGGISQVGQLMSGISSLFSVSSNQYGVAGGKIGPAEQPYGVAGGLIGPAEQATTTSNFSQAGKVAGQAMGVAGGLYSGYQGVMAQKGVGTSSGILGGAMSGGMSCSMFGPWGMAIGAVVGGIAGGIMGSKKEKWDETQSQTLEITSKLNISNKELSSISRNMIGLRKDMEGYFMPNSAYFSEGLGVSERFSLASQTGHNG